MADSAQLLPPAPWLQTPLVWNSACTPLPYNRLTTLFGPGPNKILYKNRMPLRISTEPQVQIGAAPPTHTHTGHFPQVADGHSPFPDFHPFEKEGDGINASNRGNRLCKLVLMETLGGTRHRHEQCTHRPWLAQAVDMKTVGWHVVQLQ